jgi:putative acetyltransferase
MATIRPERPSDCDQIRTVLEQAFGRPDEARLVEALRAARLSSGLVAEEGGWIVGYVAFSPVSVAGHIPPALSGEGLAPLAVLPAYQRRGIGASLVREGCDELRRCALGFVVVLGDPAYYGRFGFVPAANFGLRDEYGGGAAFQALELVPGAIPKGGGLVQYAAEFALVTGEENP